MRTPITSIRQSWDENAKEWIRMIQQEKILSREITNPAIVQAIIDYNPASVIDVGCGEGWLCRKLDRQGIKVAGVDGTAKLINYARQESSIPFRHLTYEAISQSTELADGPFEAAIFNFSLYQNEETPTLLKAVHDKLYKRKIIFIQTIHPAAFVGSGTPYQSQWMDDSWKGLEGEFVSTHKWYFRIFSGWTHVFKTCGFSIEEIREPKAMGSDRPASIIFVLS